MNLANRYEKILASHVPSTLLKKIYLKGRDEQELQYLFPSLYGSKAVTNNTKGQFVTFERQLKRGKYAPFI